MGDVGKLSRTVRGGEGKGTRGMLKARVRAVRACKRSSNSFVVPYTMPMAKVWAASNSVGSTRVPRDETRGV